MKTDTIKLPIAGLKEVLDGNVKLTDWLWRKDDRWFRPTSVHPVGDWEGRVFRK